MSDVKLPDRELSPSEVPVWSDPQRLKVTTTTRPRTTSNTLAPFLRLTGRESESGDRREPLAAGAGRASDPEVWMALDIAFSINEN